MIVIVYLDDILVHWFEHVRLVLQRLCEHWLYGKAKKCTFHQWALGVSMEVNKVAAAPRWPEPQSVKELQRFLGFVNFYRRFIRGFSAVAAPLTDMLRGKKPKTIVLTRDARNIFHRLKYAFTSAPILKLPDPERAFLVEVDALEVAIGAVLSQDHHEALPMHLLLYEIITHRTKLRYRQSRTASHKSGVRGVAALARVSTNISLPS